MPNLPTITDAGAQELAIAFVREVLARLPDTHLPTEVFQWLLAPSYTPQHGAWLAEIGRTIATLAADHRVTPAELAANGPLVAAVISASLLVVANEDAEGRALLTQAAAEFPAQGCPPHPSATRYTVG